MNNQILTEKSQSWLETLCVSISERPVGSEGNRTATDFFRNELSLMGWETRTKEFDAIPVSSQWFIENIDSQDITHTPKDNIDIVDISRLTEIADALNELIRSF